MEDLFRFLLVRPAETVEEKKVAIALEKETAFQTDLANALSAGSSREAAKEVANRFIEAGENYIDSCEKLNLGSKMLELWEQIEGHSINGLEELQEVIQTIFHKPAEYIVKSSDYNEDYRNLADSIIAIKLTPKEHNKPIAKLARVFQAMALILRGYSGDESLDEEGMINRALRAPLLFPEKLLLKQQARQAVASLGFRGARVDKAHLLKETNDKAKQIRNAMNELMRLRTTDLKIVSEYSEESSEEDARGRIRGMPNEDIPSSPRHNRKIK